MQGNYITPIIGQVYVNRNGRKYCCLSNTAYPSDEAMQKAVALGEHQAAMVRMSDGWSFTAHGLHQYEDGTVEWNYSTGGAFREDDLDKCRKMLLRKDPAMKKYFDYLDYLRDSGATNMFGAVAYLQREFPELGFDDARARQVLVAWMDSFSEQEAGGGHGNG